MVAAGTSLAMLVAVLTVLAPSASASTFPGIVGPIVFDQTAGTGINAPTTTEIWSANPDGTSAHALTTTTSSASDTDPRVSADGQWIVFTRGGFTSTSPGGTAEHLMIMRADGSDLTDLSLKATPNIASTADSEFGPSFSPDSGTLVFERFDGSTGQSLGIYKMSLTLPVSGTPNAGGVFRITNGDDESPTVSSNGQLAFTRISSTDFTTTIYTAPNICAYPCTAATALTASDPNGADQNHPDFSPDGSEMVFDGAFNGQNGLFEVSSAGGATPTLLVANPSGKSYEHPSFSPDGTQIVFDENTFTVGPGGSPTHSLLTMAATAGATPSVITGLGGTPTASNADPDWGGTSTVPTFANYIPAPGSASGPSLSSPQGVAMDGANVVVADSGDNVLKVYQPNGTWLPPALGPASGAGQLATPRRAVLVNGELITTSSFGGAVVKINPTTGANDGEFDKGGVTWQFPLGIAYDSSPAASFVAVADALNNAVYVFDTSGNLKATLTGSGSGPGALKGPEGVAFDAAGNLWVADTQNGRIVEFAKNGAASWTAASAWTGHDGGSSSFYPTGLDIDQTDDTIWVADFHSNIVAAFDSTGTLLGKITTAAAGSALNQPVDVAVDQQTSDLYVVDEGNNRVVHYKSSQPSGGGGTPPTLTIRGTTNEVGTSATLNGTVNPNGETVTDCHFDWGLDTSYGNTAPCTPAPGGGTTAVNVSADISGLTPGGNYHYRLVATNKTGTSMTDDNGFTAYAAPEATTNVPTLALANELDVAGSLINTGGADTHWYFQWGPSLDSMPNDEPAYPGTDAGVLPPGGTFVGANITGLQPNTTYCYRLVAYNTFGVTYATDANSGDPGTNHGLCAQTAGLPQPPAVANESAAASSGTTMQFSGTVNPESQFTTFFFQYSTLSDLVHSGQGGPNNGCFLENGVCTAGEVPVDDPGGQLNYTDATPHVVSTTASNLKPGTEYFYRLVAHNLAGYTYGPIESESTPEVAGTCHHELDFGPVVVTADCLTRQGLTWVSDGDLTFAGFHMSGKVIIDPLNMLVRSQGDATVSVGPWTIPGGQIGPIVIPPHQVGPITLYHGSFTWVLQGGPLINSLIGYLKGLAGGWFPHMPGVQLPPVIVKLPDLAGKLPTLPNLGLPDFSKVGSLGTLARLAGIDPGKINTDLSQPTIKLSPNLIPDVNLPDSCITTGDTATFFKLPFDADACVKITDNTTSLQAGVSIPSIGGITRFLDGGVGADVYMDITPQGQVKNVSASALLPMVTIGPLTIGTEKNPTSLSWDGNTDDLKGSGGAGLFDNSIGASGSFDILEGKLVNALLDVKTGDLPIGATGLYFNEAAVKYGADQGIYGTALLGYGPKVGWPGGSGHLMKMFIEPGYDFKTQTLHLSGDLNVLTDPTKGTYTPLTAPGQHSFHLDWCISCGEITAGASLGFTEKAKLPVLGDTGISLYGSLGGALIFGGPPQFQIDGTGSVTLSCGICGSASVEGHVTVSSKGVAVCGDGQLGPFKGNAGVGYVWGGSFDTWADPTSAICDLGAYRIMAAQAAGDGARAAGATGFLVKPGQHQVDLRFNGSGGAPQAILHGPGGALVAPPSSGDVAATANTLVLVDPSSNSTTIDLVDPAPGRWTITTAAGSPPITQALRSDLLPPPSVHAHVVVKHHHYTLVYTMRSIAGQQVTFSEQGRRLMHTIGVAKGTSGRIRFVPAYGSGGIRKLIAAVDEGGLPRETDVSGHYRAPAPVKPHRPQHLRVVRHGATAIVSWHRTIGAHGYLVGVIYNSGFRKVARTTRTRFVIHGVFGVTPVKAVVAGISGDGHTWGPKARATSPGKVPGKKHHRHKKKHKKRRR
jgi:Tol biopolymer transport system component/DNA-binding beta-propeller fold protein YncE